MTETSNISTQQYFRETADEIIFLDPVLGTDLKANEPPPSLFQDAIAAQGFSQIKKLAAEKRLTIQFLLSHHSGAEDFHSVLRKSRNTLPDAPLVAIEMDWKSAFDKVGATALDSVELGFSEGNWRRAFQNEQVRWLTQENKVIFPCEYPDNHDGPLLQNLNLLLALYDEAVKAENQRARTISFGAYQTTRQWLFISLIGYWLGQLDREGRLPTGHLKVPLMVGLAHSDVPRKLQSYFGVPNETYAVIESSVDTKDYSSYLAIFADMTTNTRISFEELDRYLESKKSI